MKRKLSLAFVVVCLIGIMGCAGMQTLTPQKYYAAAQQTYLNAWDTYHTAFLAQPDEVKAKWTKEYHPMFLKAALALQAWDMNLSSATLSADANQAIDQLTTILLSIKK